MLARGLKKLKTKQNEIIRHWCCYCFTIIIIIIIIVSVDRLHLYFLRFWLTVIFYKLSYISHTWSKILVPWTGAYLNNSEKSVVLFFWLIPRVLNFMCRRFGTPCLFHLTPPMKMEQSVPKRRHIKFRSQKITQKKQYNIQNTAKVSNPEKGVLFTRKYYTRFWFLNILCECM
jgi:hypothetical protein